MLDQLTAPIAPTVAPSAMVCKSNIIREKFAALGYWAMADYVIVEWRNGAMGYQWYLDVPLVIMGEDSATLDYDRGFEVWFNDFENEFYYKNTPHSATAPIAPDGEPGHCAFDQLPYDQSAMDQIYAANASFVAPTVAPSLLDVLTVGQLHELAAQYEYWLDQLAMVTAPDGIAIYDLDRAEICSLWIVAIEAICNL